MADTFEMAHRTGWVPTSCVLVGPIAVHKEKDGEWRLSHAATGMSIPYAYFKTRRDAIECAAALNEAIDFSRIRRAAVDAAPGFIKGWTKPIQNMLVAEMRKQGLAPAEEA